MAGEDSPWRPPSLRDRDDLEDFAYVVVEEEIDGTMGLVVAEWPSGGRGAPRFHEKGEFELAVPREELQRHVSDRRVPRTGELPDAVADELRHRPVSVGDVFAIRPTEDLDPADSERLRRCEWMGETLDVTAEAREAAKATMYEALTPPLDPHLAKRLLAESERPTEPGEPAA
jgi:hypothetical protein